MKASPWPLVFVAASITCANDETTAEVQRTVQTDVGPVTVTGTAYHHTWEGCTMAAAPHAGLFCLLPASEAYDAVRVTVAVPNRPSFQVPLDSLETPDEAQLGTALESLALKADLEHVVLRADEQWRVYDFLPAGPAWLAEVSPTPPTTLPPSMDRIKARLADADFRATAPEDFWATVQAQPAGGPLDDALLAVWPAGTEVRSMVEARAAPGSGVGEGWRVMAEAQATQRLFAPDTTDAALDVLIALEAPMARVDELLLLRWPEADAVVRKRLARGRADPVWSMRMASKASAELRGEAHDIAAAGLILDLGEEAWRREAVARLVARAAAVPEAMPLLAGASAELRPEDCTQVGVAVTAWPHTQEAWALVEAAVPGVCADAVLPVAVDQWPLGDRAHAVVMRALEAPSPAVRAAVRARAAAVGEAEAARVGEALVRLDALDAQDAKDAAERAK